MSVSVPPISTNSTGQAEQGTAGTTIANASAQALNTNQFLDLMLDSLQEQNPLDPSSTDPTQYLSELAQMTAVEQETSTAQSTAQSASEQAVSQAVALIGDTVSYTDHATGKSASGTVSSVQITSSGPTLTIGGTAGINPTDVTAVAVPQSATAGGPAGATGATGAASGATGAAAGATGAASGAQ